MNYYMKRDRLKRSKAYNEDMAHRHGEMLANRAKKNFRRLRPGFEREQIDAFRIYDWDIPEVRAVLDWYKGELLLSEYAREQTEQIPYLDILSEHLASSFSLPREKIHCRKRHTRPAHGERYPRLSQSGHRLEIRERDLKFLVNLNDYLDTGLFLDHRNTRMKIRDISSGKQVLNLYAYTASFSVYAAKGGAALVESVDASKTYLTWASENFRINGFSHSDQIRFVESTVEEYLQRAPNGKWDIIILDPPSFSGGRGKPEFDILKDHRRLVERVLSLLAPQGMLLFSTNHQRFVPDLANLPCKTCRETTADTIPADFQGRTPHRCFELRK
jgi:23S rRNA (cytosine1962-C5)-methyltransferase